MKLNTNELIKDTLDVAVALALGYEPAGTATEYGYRRWRTPENEVLCYAFCPSGDWSFCGRLMVQHTIRWNKDGDAFYAWMSDHAYMDPLHEPMMEGHQPIQWEAFQYGEDLCVAILRAFVQKTFGDVVDIPDRILEDVFAEEVQPSTPTKTRKETR